MAQTQIPDSSQLLDTQVVTVSGPDGLTTQFVYDSETNSLYQQEGPVLIPSFHGSTHIAEDPVPIATTDTQGHMSSSDKAKLDALTQNRIGILGFNGAGFPDDGGFLQGDVILSSGSDQLAIERIGNVVRFTLRSSQQFCGCEECAQIFWIQDESDTSSIRPSSCAGRLPGLSGYGELKIYQLPDSTTFDPTNPLSTLNQKSFYPSLIFRRFSGLTSALGEYQLILERNSDTTTKVGWAMTPGSTGTPECVWFMGTDDDGEQIRFELLPEANPDILGLLIYKGHSLTSRRAVVTGYDSTVLSTNLYAMRFWDTLNTGPVGDEFNATNVWRYNNPENDPLDPSQPRSLVVDATVSLLPVGHLVDVWEFQVGETAGSRIVRRFFSERPPLNPQNVWSLSGLIRFGELLTARREVDPGDPSVLVASTEDVNDLRTVERSVWGITGFEDPLYLADDGEATDVSQGAMGVLQSDSITAIGSSDEDFPLPNVIITGAGATMSTDEFINKTLQFTSGVLTGQQFQVLTNSTDTYTVFGEIDGADVGDSFVIIAETMTFEPSGAAVNNQFVAEIDETLPGLVVSTSDPSIDTERPVYLWHRTNHKDIYLKALIGMPESSIFPPLDILLRAPGDSFDDVYVKVKRRGRITTGPWAGRYYIVVKGVHFRDLPASGVLRTLTGFIRDEVWAYDFKANWALTDDDGLMLVGDTENPFFFDEDVDAEDASAQAGLIDESVTVPGSTTVAQLLHADYNAPAARLEFSVNSTTEAESVQLQVRAGTLDMNEAYELNRSLDQQDDLVRGFTPGEFSSSQIFTQDGFITVGTETPGVDPEGFRVVSGGFATDGSDTTETELWNTLEIMYRGNQMWIWWNGLLIPPDPETSAALPTPVAVSTPYFPVTSDLEVGKVIFRLWPGAKMREIEIRDPNLGYTEFVNGQLTISSG